MKCRLLLAFLTLSGCGVLAPFAGPPPGQLVPVTELQPLAAPPSGAALWAEIGPDAGRARLVRQEQERRIWRLDTGFVFVTEGARVIATAGLETTLLATHFLGEDPLRGTQALGPAPLLLARGFDTASANGKPEDMRFGQLVQCRLEPPEDALDGLLERAEICEGAAYFTNRFWFRASDGALVRSEQWIGRRVPPLRLEVAVMAP